MVRRRLGDTFQAHPNTGTVSPHIVSTTADAVCSIELQRRDKKNAITTAMYAAMADALEAAAEDQAVAAVLLHGQADLFTAGNDLADFLSPAARETRAALRFLHTLAGFPKPIVAAVGGAAIGIGTTLLLHCDFVVAGQGARFQLPFVKLGLCPEGGSSALLPQLAGHRLAAELLLLGEPFGPDVAREARIVNRVVPDEELLPTATALARQLAQMPRDAMQTSKALLKRSPGRTGLEAIDDEYPHFARLTQSQEARSIFRAFLERK